MKKIIVLLAIIALMMGCKTTSSYKLTPQALGDQEIKDRGIVKDIVSHKKASVFVRSSADIYTSDNETRPSFVVGAYGEREFEFSTDNIKVYVDGKPHRIITYEDLLKEMNDALGIRLETAKKQWEAEALKATQDAVKDIDDPVFADPVDPSQSRPANNSSGVRLAKTAIDTRQLSEDFVGAGFKATVEAKDIQNEAIEGLKTLRASALIKKNVPPKEWYPGKVTLDYIPDSSTSQKIKIIVSVLGEDHEFLLDYMKLQ